MGTEQHDDENDEPKRMSGRQADATYHMHKKYMRLGVGVGSALERGQLTSHDT